MISFGIIIIYFRREFLDMKQVSIQKQYQLQSTSQVDLDSVKKTTKQGTRNNQVSLVDLCGLSWDLFEDIN